LNRSNFIYWFCIFSAVYHFTSRFGMSIDIQWHTDVGRDEFFTPPHFMVLGGLPICFALCLYFILTSANSKHVTETEGHIKISKFHAPAEIWLTLVGLVTILIGGFYDNYWHAQFGVDTTIVTPPHILTLSGGNARRVFSNSSNLQILSGRW